LGSWPKDKGRPAVEHCGIDVHLKSGGVWTWVQDYVYRDGAHLATVDSSGTRHFHLDHLGTVRLITNSSGSQVALHTYYPFGQEATSTSQDSERMKFTGHELDLRDSSGTTDDLDNMHARHYNPNLGRFLSVDPGRDVDPRIPQAWNMYAYVRGNPLRLVDPNGQGPIDSFFQSVREFLTGVANTALNLSGASGIVGPPAPRLDSPSYEAGEAYVRFVATHNLVAEAALTVGPRNPALGVPSVTVGASVVNGRDFYLFGGLSRGFSISPVDLSLSVGVVRNYGGSGDYRGPFGAVTSSAPLGLAAAANPSDASKPQTLSLNLSTNVGGPSVSYTKYLHLFSLCKSADDCKAQYIVYQPYDHGLHQ
jgi:RHS repeat-associated protein